MFETIKSLKSYKNSLWGAPTDFVHKDRACRGYFAKMGCKIDDEFTDIFVVVGRHFGWAVRVFCLAFTAINVKQLCKKLTDFNEISRL